MVRISQKPLKRRVFKEISGELLMHFVEVKTEREVKRLLFELLGESERLMLAKRLTLIFMLAQGDSFEEIRKRLKMSQATIVRYWRFLKQEHFPFLLEKIKEKKKKEAFWQKLESISRGGLPPRGRGRWRRVYEALDSPAENIKKCKITKHKI